jgi:hypothetical protein
MANVQTVAPHAVEFNTRKFEAAHGKQPRGYGQWGFCPREHYDANDYLDHVQWFTGTYASAKKSARAFYSVQPNVFEVVVCS